MAKKVVAKKKVVKIDAVGQAHIHSSFNNIIISLLLSSFFLICDSLLLTLTSTSIVLCALTT